MDNGDYYGVNKAARNAVACESYSQEFSYSKKTFPTKTLAKAWARRIEHQMDSGAWIDRCACFAP